MPIDHNIQYPQAVHRRMEAVDLIMHCRRHAIPSQNRGFSSSTSLEQGTGINGNWKRWEDRCAICTYISGVSFKEKYTSLTSLNTEFKIKV